MSDIRWEHVPRVRLAHLPTPLEPAPTEVTLLGDYGGPAYGTPGPAALDAIRLAARTEGLFVDPVYTRKALSGLIDWARSGRLDPDEPVLFWHTGGVAGLFAGTGT